MKISTICTTLLLASFLTSCGGDGAKDTAKNAAAKAVDAGKSTVQAGGNAKDAVKDAAVAATGAVKDAATDKTTEAKH
jgi:hypothetical protein